MPPPPSGRRLRFNLEFGMTDFDGNRRTRGPSALGDFEQSKSIALDVIAKERAAEQVKTARLKALRVEREAEKSAAQ